MRRNMFLAMMLGLGMVSWPALADQGQKGKEQPPGPPARMKLLEVFPTNNYTVVSLKFFDAKGKPTKPTSGVFSYWSNFLVDKRAPAKKRRIELSRASEHNFKYTLKLPGFKRLCPPRVARLRITFKSDSPRKRFVKTWTKKAQCH